MVKDKSILIFVNIGMRAICTIFMEEGAIETSNPDCLKLAIEDDLELLTLLSLPPGQFDRNAPPHPVYMVLGMGRRASGVLGESSARWTTSTAPSVLYWKWTLQKQHREMIPSSLPLIRIAWGFFFISLSKRFGDLLKSWNRTFPGSLSYKIWKCHGLNILCYTVGRSTVQTVQTRLRTSSRGSPWV